MNTGKRRLLQSAWPLAMLLLFAGTFRRGPQSTEAAASDDCEGTIESTAVLERCADSDPRRIDLMVRLAQRYEQEGRADRAEPLYRRALSIDPGDGDVRLRLGTLLLARGDAEGARAQAAIAVKRLPGSPEAAALLARASASRSRADQEQGR